MADTAAEQPFYARLKSGALALGSYISTILPAGARLVAIIGLIAVLATAHLWVPAWWQSFRDALFPSEGQIIVGSPGVYTRQRLVNDRLSQTSWLQDQMKVTESLDQKFRGIDEVRFEMKSSATKVAVKKPTAGTPETDNVPPAATTSSPTDQDKEMVRSNSPPIEPTTADLFRMKNTYREEVRAEIMETQLDDRHDIRGNTIYRLAFDATILPGTKADALAVIKVKLTHNSQKMLDDYSELYFDWMRRMQSTIDKSIENIINQLVHRQPEPRIRLTLSDFVLEKICNPEQPPGTPKSECNSRSDSEKMRAAKKKLSEFSTAYQIFRSARLRQRILETILSDPKAKQANPEQIKIAASSFKQTCDQPPFLKAQIPLGSDKLEFDCLPTDSPLEGLNGALLLLRDLARASFEEVINALKLDADGKPIACIVETGCLTNEPSPAEYRCFAARYILDNLNKPVYGSEQGRRPISEFFDVSITSQEVNNCNVQLAAKWTPDTIHLLAGELNNGIELYTYNVTPKNLVQRVATASDTRDAVQVLLNSNFEIYGTGASTVVDNLRKRAAQSQRIQANPVIVSFGVGRHSYRPKHDPFQPTQWSTDFGWAVAPQFDADGSGNRRHGERQYSLAAVISVPAWWRSVELDVVTCWMDRRSFVPDNSAVCPQEENAANRKRKHTGLQPDTVRLPGAINELSHKLGFDVIQEPQLYSTTTPDSPLQLQIGRPATLLLTGGRIWRSTEVTLGSQKADEIVVLPNMEGILAKFRCVRRQYPTGKILSTSDQPVSVDIKVWTSEGVTAPTYALLVPAPSTPPPAGGVANTTTSAAAKDTRDLCPDELRDLRLADQANPEPAR